MLTKLQQQYYDLLKKDGVVPDSQAEAIRGEIRKMNAIELRQAIQACGDNHGERQLALRETRARRKHGRS